MMPLKSINMEPQKESFNRIFLKSQFCAKPHWPPTSTDLSSNVAIVTGASSGLGFHCCRHLLSLNLSRLIIAVRSVKKGEEAAAKLRSEYQDAQIEVWELEMGSYESIQAFTNRIETQLTRLDIAILNAGIVKTEFGLNSSTGHEEVVQINYISTMLLAILLFPALKAKSQSQIPGRLTIVGSGTAYGSNFLNRAQEPLLASFDDVKITPWDPSERYSCSKLLGQLFFVKLIDHIDADNVIVNIVDPGFCKGSSLHRDASGIVGFIVSLAKSITGRTLEDGSSTYVDAAVVKGKESHGCFVMDWEIKPFASMVYAPETKSVIDRLWDETMKEIDFAEPLKILEDLRKRT